ncbi:MAG: hypothetical protein ACRDFR_03985 [Candidatus Limnocylindria bacterium]
MKVGTTHYRLLDSDFRKVAALYRIRYSPDALYVERFDPGAGSWIPGPATFLRFPNTGEDEISEGEAWHIIAAGILPPIPRRVH